jgi:hypothetical protein
MLVRRSPWLSPATHTVLAPGTHEIAVSWFESSEIVEDDHVIGCEEAGPPLPDPMPSIRHIVGLCGPFKTFVPFPPSSVS